MTVSWTWDRVGPLCRTVEDCALVLRAITGPDEQDPSVVDLPFNWDASLDIRTLRVGYLASGFQEAGRHEDWGRNDRRVLDELSALGIKPEPFELPRLPLHLVNPVEVEAPAFFEELRRTGRLPGNITVNRLIPAVEYVQSQRVRTAIMREFAKTVSRFDVYVAPLVNMRVSAAELAESLTATGPGKPSSVISAHFLAANLCTYPAVSVPNGFTSDRVPKPTGITFMGRLYGEAPMLALARAYEQRAGWHLKHPTLRL
jgi:Asp-tRNA(Asn)/Glu-tRNA(Gln) amidotransferase A subunit family amidase